MSGYCGCGNQPVTFFWYKWVFRKNKREGMMANSVDPDPITASKDYTDFRSSVPQRKVSLLTRTQIHCHCYRYTPDEANKSATVKISLTVWVSLSRLDTSLIRTNC